MSSEASTPKHQQQQPQGCPVDHGKAASSSSSSSSWSWFKSSSSSSNASSNPAKLSTTATTTAKTTTKTTATQGGGGCPVKHDKDTSGLPASIEEAARHAQSPHADQRIALSTHRVISTIPRADELRATSTAAPHQPTTPVLSSNDSTTTSESTDNKWVYPSEQQFYNAMRRKGWQGIDEATMPSVVRIHNAVNERGWGHVRKWERALHDNPTPRLVRFLGRPNDMSPRAFFNTYLFWYNAPFDRHDWFVDRGDGKEPRRYVIDFYNGDDGNDDKSGGIVSSIMNRFSSSASQPQQQPQQPAIRPPVTMYLDVRPALDTPEAFSDRLQMFFMDGFPGIYAAWKQQTTSPASSSAPSTTSTSTEEKPSSSK